jgi:hypothetical protein
MHVPFEHHWSNEGCEMAGIKSDQREIRGCGGSGRHHPRQR